MRNFIPAQRSCFVNQNLFLSAEISQLFSFRDQSHQRHQNFFRVGQNFFWRQNVPRRRILASPKLESESELCAERSIRVILAAS